MPEDHTSWGPTPVSVGALLAHDRLVSRAARLEGVVAALRGRATLHRSNGRPVPVPLACSLEGFERELAAARQLLEVSGRCDVRRVPLHPVAKEAAA